MTHNELRTKFLEFFKSKGHQILSPASLVPKDDPSVLFTSAGMQQFKRFYLNPDEAPVKVATTCQPCVRTSDIEEVGDETHLTFFEMLGNFSFNDYFKKEAIEYAWEFLTETLSVDKNRIFATYFEGNDIAPADEESLSILKTIDGLKEIKPQGYEDNFWSLGTENSPGGPTVEFYIDNIEIWNLVFNEYVFKNGKFEKNKFHGVDTGMGLERMLATLNGKTDVYQTDVFEPIINQIEELTGKKYNDNKNRIRRIADHSRASVNLIQAGILPSNKEHGYTLRVLLRVSFMELGNLINQDKQPINNIEDLNIALDRMFPDVSTKVAEIYDNNPVAMEEFKTYQNLKKPGFEYFKSYSKEEFITGEIIFKGRDTFGLSPEGVVEIWKTVLKKRISTNWKEEYDKAFRRHRELSKTASAGMFKGGLTTQSEQATKYHTATHLLLAALRQVLGSEIHQRGSNITDERLRFDFSYPEKLTDEQIQKVEQLVNEKIKEDLPVTCEQVKLEDAQARGIIGEFNDKYAEEVKVYTIGPTAQRIEPFSQEICGGPHVEHTGILGHFKITKEESSSAGVRRIKAILE